MNELIMPHNVGVKNVLENMKELLALYKMMISNYRPLLDGERYLTDREVAQILHPQLKHRVIKCFLLQTFDAAVM